MDWLDWGMETLRAFLYKGVRLITVASVTLSVDIVRRTLTIERSSMLWRLLSSHQKHQAIVQMLLAASWELKTLWSTQG